MKGQQVALLQLEHGKVLHPPLDLVALPALIIDNLNFHEALHAAEVALDGLGAHLAESGQLFPTRIACVLKLRENHVDPVDVITGGIAVDPAVVRRRRLGLGLDDCGLFHAFSLWSGDGCSGAFSHEYIPYLLRTELARLRGKCWRVHLETSP